MKNYRLLNITILLFILISISFAQNSNSTLAKVGNETITVQDFQDRFNFMPHINYSHHNQDSLKKEFLFSLIAEKVWALEGRERRYDTNTVFLHSIKSLEKLFVKDELFRKEVESKIYISSDEIIKALERFNKNLFIKFIVSVDSSEIFNVYSELIHKSNFDSLLEVQSESKSQKNSILLKVGSLENEFIEDILFSMDKGQYTAPIKFKGKWFIIKIDSAATEAGMNDSPEVKKNKVINLLTDRKRKSLANNFLDKILGGKTIKSNRVLFDELIEKLYAILKNKHKTYDSLHGQIIIDGEDIINTLQSFDKQKLNSEFAKINNSVLTLNDLIFYLYYQKLEIPRLNKNLLKKLLNNSVKQFLEDEILVDEAYHQSLEKLETVKENVKLWYDYYLAEYSMNKLRDLVKESSSDDLSTKSPENMNSYNIQVNIIEIFNKDLDTLNKVLNEINKGSDFLQLAEKFNQREYTKASKGEWGFFLPTAAGEIGRITMQLKIGEIYGPIKVNGGYSIIKLIDRRVLNDSSISLPKNIELENEKIFLTSFDRILNSKTAELANKYQIKINNYLLNKIELSDINIFTYKLIGFGGRIAAFPITIPIYNWIKDYQKGQKIP